jgi:enoyl-CoA hydratase/carnithine racemase
MAPPPFTPNFVRLSYPTPRVLLVTMCREENLNCISTSAQIEMDAVWRWLDEEPTLSVAVITGAGDKAFSAGADLKEWNDSMRDDYERVGSARGFTPLSRRLGKKPVIAAVNGLALGAGAEFVANCDLVIAADTAYFGLPEVKRGVAAIGGCLPRLIRIVGLQRASEFALTGRNISAQEALVWGLVNKVVPRSEVVKEAVRYATLIAGNSPDAIICTRAGLRQGWETAAVEQAVEITKGGEWAELQKGENIREGLKAFVEKRPPRWSPSKL